MDEAKLLALGGHRAREVPARGEALFLVPRHVCPTVNLAESAVLVESGEVVDVVPVAGRAHELWCPRDDP